MSGITVNWTGGAWATLALVMLAGLLCLLLAPVRAAMAKRRATAHPEPPGWQAAELARLLPDPEPPRTP